MPDLREAFEMVKQQTQPDQDSWAEQERRIRQSQRKRKYGALALVAALALVVAAVVARNLVGDDRSVVPTSDGPTIIVPAGPGFAFLDIATGETTGTGIAPGNSEVDVSPDGTEITYVNHRDLVAVANLDGTKVRSFDGTASAGGPTAPRWSPDGTKIVYQGRGSGGVIGNLYVLDVTSGRVEQITHLPPLKAGLYYMAPGFSTDGRSVLFTMPTVVASGPNGRQLEWDLWTVPASGGDAALLLKDAGYADADPTGDSIAFVALRSGSGDADPKFGGVYVARSDGTEARKLADGETFVPRWSPDGSEVAYNDSLAGIYVVDVATGDSQTVYPDGWPEWVDQKTLIIDLSD